MHCGILFFFKDPIMHRNQRGRPNAHGETGTPQSH